MKRIIPILLLLLLNNTTFGQDNSKISEVDIYTCINDALIPYLSSIGDTNIQVGSNAWGTVFNYELYNKAIWHLKNELNLDRDKVKYMRRQIRSETDKWLWEQEKIINANVSDTLPYYEGYHFSRPIISKDKSIFIIVKYATEKPSGWCGTVDSYYISMVFKKTEDKWILLKMFEDERRNY